MTVAEALAVLSERKAALDAARAVVAVAENALRDAWDAVDVAASAVRQAELDARVARGRAWLDEHPEAIGLIRADRAERTDKTRKAMERLGLTHGTRQRHVAGKSHTFWTTTLLGEAVDAALAAEVKP